MNLYATSLKKIALIHEYAKTGDHEAAYKTEIELMSLVVEAAAGKKYTSDYLARVAKVAIRASFIKFNRYTA